MIEVYDALFEMEAEIEEVNIYIHAVLASLRQTNVSIESALVDIMKVNLKIAKKELSELENKYKAILADSLKASDEDDREICAWEDEPIPDDRDPYDEWEMRD